jgi:hypothetical protein
LAVASCASGARGKAAASALLAPVYEWFRERFDTRNLKDAKALLEDVRAYVVMDKGQLF